MKRFRGSADVKIDDRGRIKIPAKFLSVFDSCYSRDVFVSSLNGNNVVFYPVSVWEDLEQRIENIGMWDPDVDELSNRYSYWGSESEIDSKGRILVPPVLRQASELNGTVRILGKANHLVVWNEENFKAEELGEHYSKEKLYRVSRKINEIASLSRDE